METALVAANLALSAAVLVFAFVVYRVARELRAARSMTVRPQLVLDLHVLNPGQGVLALRNVGKGPAIDIRASLRFQPLGETRDIEIDLLAPGERKTVVSSQKGQKAMTLDLESLAASVRRISINGTARDALGAKIQVAQRVDVAERLASKQDGSEAGTGDTVQDGVRELAQIRAAVVALEGQARVATKLLKHATRRLTPVE